MPYMTFDSKIGAEAHYDQIVKRHGPGICATLAENPRSKDGWIVSYNHPPEHYRYKAEVDDPSLPMQVGGESPATELDILKGIWKTVELIKESMTTERGTALQRERKADLDFVAAERDRIEELYVSVSHKLNGLRKSISEICCAECGIDIGNDPPNGEGPCDACDEFKVALKDSWYPPKKHNQPSYAEHQLVQLIEAQPAAGLLEGSLGTIVHMYRDGRACEVEFAGHHGPKVMTIMLSQIKPTQGE